MGQTVREAENATGQEKLHVFNHELMWLVCHVGEVLQHHPGLAVLVVGDAVKFPVEYGLEVSIASGGVIVDFGLLVVILGPEHGVFIILVGDLRKPMVLIDHLYLLL